MATKKKKVEETGVLPVDFFGDVVSVQAPAIITYEYKYGDKFVVVKCKPSLNYKEKAEFVKGVWDIFYSADVSGRRDYRPYLIDLCVRFFTLKLYCINVPIDDSVDIGVYENFLINTNFYDVLLQHINLVDYKSLLKSTNMYLDKMSELHAAAVRSNADMTIESIMTAVLDFIGGVDKEKLTEFFLSNVKGEDSDENKREVIERATIVTNESE